MLIKAYGQFWNPNLIDWGSTGRGNSGKLIGEVTRSHDQKKYKIDFWHAKGLYVLYSDFKAVYVGKAIAGDAGIIGKRVRDHLTDRHAGRWDMFSWFSLSAPRYTELDVSAPGQRQVQPGDVANSLEALAILIADPPLNRRQESLVAAVEATQVASPGPKTIRAYLEEVLAEVKKIQPAGDED
jgi:hypothetical protein